MKVTFFTRDYANVSGGHNTWLCRFLPDLRRRGVESRLLCFHLSPQEEFPTARSGQRCVSSSILRGTVATRSWNSHRRYMPRRGHDEFLPGAFGRVCVGQSRLSSLGFRLYIKGAGAGCSRTASDGNFGQEHSLRGSDSRKCGEKTQRPAEACLRGATG